MALPERARATEGSMAAAAVGPMALRVAAEAVHRTFASPRFIKSSIPAVVSLLLPAGAAAAALGAAGTLLVDQAATLARRERREQAEFLVASLGNRARHCRAAPEARLRRRRTTVWRPNAARPRPPACSSAASTPSSRTCGWSPLRSRGALPTRRSLSRKALVRWARASHLPLRREVAVAGYSFAQRGCRVASPRPLATLVV